MVVKSVSKEVCFFTNLIWILILTTSTLSIATCDRRLMNEFGLTGMKIAIADAMKVCGPIKDKCCTVTDEIRITKYWSTYTSPFLMRHASDYMAVMNQIVQSFFTLMRIDPRLIMLKYVARKEIPYNYKVCTSFQHKETPQEREEFLQFHDKRLEYELAPSFYRISSNKGKTFDLTKFTHDERGDRHWDVRYTPDYLKMEEKMLKDYKIKIDMPEIEATNLTCPEYSHTYNKEFIIVNDKKSDFCLSLYDKFLNLNIRHLKGYLETIKNDLTQVHSYKSSLYCILCNAHEQRYIDPLKKQLIVSEEFCRTLLTDKEDYFKFVHILFVEFMDSLLQYVQCFETDAKVYTFPYMNFLTKFKRRIPFLRSCFDNLNSKSFMTYCWFLCEKFDMMKITPFFDGDVKLLRRVQIAIFSFVRKMRIETAKYHRLNKRPMMLTKRNVNGMLIEPLNPSHIHTRAFYLEKKHRIKLLGKLDTRLRLPNKQAEDLLEKFLKAMGFGTVQDIKNLRRAHKRLKKEQKRMKKQMKQVTAVKHMTKRMKKRIERRRKSYKNQFSYINGLYNYFWRVKTKHRIHEGFFPQRKLLNNPKIKSRLVNTFVKLGLNRLVVDQKIEQVVKKADQMVSTNSTEPTKVNATVSDEFVEVPHQIFEKNEPGYNVKYFKLEVAPIGANPLKEFILVDYRFNITTLISLKFQKEEDLDRDTILTYLQSTPRDVNEFNFDVKNYFNGYKETGSGSPKYIGLKMKHKMATLKGDRKTVAKTNKKLKVFEQRAAKEIKMKSDAMTHQLAKKKARDAAVEIKRNKKVIANHHIDSPTYKYNFYDIKDFFMHMFGP